MKKVLIKKTLKIFVGTLILTLLFGLWIVHAATQEELDEAKAIIEQKVSCTKLADEQLELIGEYYMEQMHPGDSHKTMHEIMGLEEGSETEEQFHINMAKTMYCGESGGMMGSNNMMQSGGMMGNGAGMMMPMGMMMNMMSGGMMGSNMMGNFGGGMMGNNPENYEPYGYTPWWTIMWYLFWIAVIALLIWFVYNFIIKKERDNSALQILKKRFIKGEITKKKFEEMKNEIEE